MSVRLKPGPKQTHEEAAHAASFMFGSLAHFSDPAYDVPVSRDDIAEEDVPCVLRDLKSKNDRGPSRLQCVLELCQAYGLALPFYVRTVHTILNAALAVMGFADKNRTSLANLKNGHEYDKTVWEKLLKQFQDR